MASSVLPPSSSSTSTSTPEEDFDPKQHKRFFGGGHLQQFPVPAYNQPVPDGPGLSGHGVHHPESKFFMSSLLNLHQNPNGGKRSSCGCQRPGPDLIKKSRAQIYARTKFKPSHSFRKVTRPKSANGNTQILA